MEKNSTQQLAELLVIQKEIISSVDRPVENNKKGIAYDNNRSGITITSSIRTAQ